MIFNLFDLNFFATIPYLLGVAKRGLIMGIFVQKYIRMTWANYAGIAFGLSLCSFIVAPILPTRAQYIQQGINNEAWQVQNGLHDGALNPGQAAQLGGEVNQIQQQAQLDRAVNGGQLTPAQQQQVHAEMQGVRQNMRGDALHNGVNPQAINGPPGGILGQHYWHHHQFNGMYPQYGQNPTLMPNGYPPPNVQYPNPYQPNRYLNYQSNPYYNGQPYNNYAGYPYQQNPASYQQGGLSGAAQLLKRLF
jgi:hypothetical protein